MLFSHFLFKGPPPFFCGSSQSVVLPDYSFLTFQFTHHLHIFIRNFRSRRRRVTQCSSFCFFFPSTFRFTVLLLRNVSVLLSAEGPAFIPRPKRVLILGHFVLYFSLFILLLALCVCVCVSVLARALVCVHWERNIGCLVKITELHVFKFYMTRCKYTRLQDSKSTVNTVIL